MRPALPALPALTGLRFFAAATVVAFHFAPLPMLSDSLAGPTAVMVFFVLSGFILTYTARPGTPALTFYVARLARIYPVYLLALALAGGLLAAVGWNHESAWCPEPVSLAAPQVLLMVQAWRPGNMDCLDGPAWTLSCEAFFYALFPLLLPLLRRLSRRGTSVALALCYGAGPLCAALDLPRPLVFLSTFVAGMLLGRLYLQGRPLWNAHLMIVLACCCLVLGQGTPLLPGEVTQTLLCPACVVLLGALADGGSVAARLLARRPVVLLGEASYGLYILHAPLHNVLLVDGLFARLAAHPWIGFSAYGLCAVAVSLASLRLLETPARRALRAALSPARRRRAATPPAAGALG